MDDSNSSLARQAHEYEAAAAFPFHHAEPRRCVSVDSLPPTPFRHWPQPGGTLRWALAGTQVRMGTVRTTNCMEHAGSVSAPNTPRPAPLTIHKPAAVRRDAGGADAQVQLGKVLHHLWPSGGGPTAVVARWCNHAGGAAHPSCHVQEWHSLRVCGATCRCFRSQTQRTANLLQACRTSSLQQQLLLPERT